MDKLEHLRYSMERAAANGWVSYPSLIAIRLTVHQTHPRVIRSGLWTEPTYECREVLDFVFHGPTNRVPSCVLTVRSRSWVPEHRERISYRRAVILLDQPLADSITHTNHW